MLDRSGRHPKIHDWQLYVDVVNGDLDVLQNLAFNLGPKFKPETFVCPSPVSVTRPDGSRAWRFSTRQQTFGSSGTEAKIQLKGSGGTTRSLSHRVVLDKNKRKNQNRSSRTFSDKKGKKPLASLVETSVSGEVRVTGYRTGRETSSSWKILPYASIQCHHSVPNCNTFELVSLVLQGENGLHKVTGVLKALGNFNHPLQ